MGLIVKATPLSEDAFRPYGGILAANLKIPTTLSNPGAKKTIDAVTPTDLYAAAPSGQPSRSVIVVEVIEPKVCSTPGRVTLDRMERHPFTSQVFIPMGSGFSYLAIVADYLPDADAPDLKTLKVFEVAEGQGVCYGAGVWHASMHNVGNTPITFVVVQYVNGVAAEDCDIFCFPEPDVVEIGFSSKGIAPSVTSTESSYQQRL